MIRSSLSYYGFDRLNSGGQRTIQHRLEQAAGTSPKLELPTNISIIAIPSKCPELNPVENIWQFMRDNWLSNRVFVSYDDIIDHCCYAWNKLVDQPWKIMSIGSRDWAQGF